MAYVQCSKCNNTVHFKPIDVVQFHKDYIEDKKEILCFSCFKEKYPLNEEKDAD